MKQLTCEMCGSTDLMKQDGVFVCQTCGTKYSVEEAKKMMIEGTVEVAGTVKVDNTSSIANYLMMAKNAYEADNKKEAETYCNKIIEIDPTNYEAWLLKGRAAGWQSTLANIRIEESVNSFTKAIETAPGDKVEDIKKTAAKEIENLCVSLVKLCCNNYGKNGTVDNADRIIKNTNKVKVYALMLLARCGVEAQNFNGDLSLAIFGGAIDGYNNIYKSYMGSTGHPSKAAWDTYTERAWKNIDLMKLSLELCKPTDSKGKKYIYMGLIQVLQALEKSGSYTYYNGAWKIEYRLALETRQKIVDQIMDYHKKIKEIDPTYNVPESPQPTKSGGCYVATAVYGSYDCPQVWTLRRYRDCTLAGTWYGRAFIRTYYAVSPTLVKWFGHTDWFKNMWRGKLDRMVSNLQKKGVESTPYEDRVW